MSFEKEPKIETPPFFSSYKTAGSLLFSQNLKIELFVQFFVYNSVDMNTKVKLAMTFTKIMTHLRFILKN